MLKQLSGGECQLVVINKKTGDIMYDGDVILESYTQIMDCDPFQPIFGTNGTREYFGRSPVKITMTLRELNRVQSAPMTIKLGKECNHAWITYHGFNEYFEYCKNCSQKKQ